MSKFCGNCGAQLEDSAMFCGACGAKQAAPAAAQTPVAVPVTETVGADGSIAPNNPMSPETKKKVIIIGVIAAALVILGIIVGIVVNELTKYQVIDCKELYMVDYNGINGYATATVMPATPENYKKLVSDDMYEEFQESEYFEKYDVEGFCNSKASKWFATNSKTMKKAWTKADSNSEMRKMQKKLLDNIEFVVDEESLKDLSNGDEIKVKVKYKEEKLKKQNIKLENDSFTIKVEGLVEPIVIDPWEGVNVTFEGADSMGTFSIDTEGVNELAKEAFSYYYYEDGNVDRYALKNGDVIKVEASPWYSLRDGYFVKDDTYYTYDEKALIKEFTVSGLKELTVIDPFENVVINYTDAAPTIRAEINDEACPEYIKDYISFNYDYDDLRNLNIGDTFTIDACTWYEDKLAELGYRLESDKVTKEFTVPDSAPRYIQDIADVKKVDTDKLFSEIIEKNYYGAIGKTYLGWTSLGGKIVRYDSVNFGAAYLVAPSEIAGSGNTYYQTGTFKMTLEVDGANVSKSIAFLIMADGAYVDGNGELGYTDTWLGTTENLVMEDLIKDNIKNDSNMVDGKVITSLKKIPVATSDAPAEDTPADDTPTEEETDTTDEAA